MTLVFAKAREAPLRVITTPRAELVVANLQVKLLHYVAILFKVDKSNLFTWIDSAIVLCWFYKTSSNMKTLVPHHI